MPYTISKSVPQPLIEGFEFDLYAGESVIIDPPPTYLCQLFKSFFKFIGSGFLKSATALILTVMHHSN